MDRPKQQGDEAPEKPHRPTRHLAASSQPGSVEPGGHGTASIVPIRPCDSSPIPAVKKRVVGVPATPLPKRRPHRPLIAMTLPSSFLSWPSKWPVVGL